MIYEKIIKITFKIENNIHFKQFYFGKIIFIVVRHR